ncbi:MAG: hypothetical protein U0T57_01955 [Buchnera aphidicola (Kaburagia rhusicola rhusicola)]
MKKFLFIYSLKEKFYYKNYAIVCYFISEISIFQLLCGVAKRKFNELSSI